MSHHSSDKSLTNVSAEAMEEFKEMANRDLKQFKKEHASIETQIRAKQQQLDDALGPTGTHPAGRLVAHDEGGLMFGITVFNGRVIIDFGKPVRSIGFTRNDALELAKALKVRAKQCPPIIGEPEPVDD